MTRARNRLEHGAVVVVRLVARCLPRPLSLGLGTALGRLFHALHRPRRELAVANLRAAFPARSDAECRAILRATFEQFGRHVVDFLNFSGMRPERMLALVEVDGAAHVERAQARGRGVMYFTGHFGSWELQVLVHAYRFGPIVMVARTLDNPLLERMIERLRGSAGTRVVPRRGAVRGLLGALKRGESVGMMIDQHMQDRSAVEVSFFRRSASTTSAIAALALRTGAPIIPVFALPIPRGRYRLVYEAPVEPPAPDDPDPVRTYTQRCTDVLETYVRRYPHLWLWMHRRWRAPAEPGEGPRPEGVG
ncbi:MAG: lysophospholipid acyltransferase family protein [Acidobacteria bacterium]|nr:lysophospholipid acyltransferase family protein [Acidobacteriota bacterium]